jgi:MerR family transcriptional regulator, thiopeptide resistance regulator
MHIIPVLVYEDIAAAYDFLVRAFGLEPIRIDRDPGGNVVHGEVGTGEDTIWLHRATPEHGLTSPLAHPDATGGLAVTVEDVDAHYARAVAAGASIDHPPVDQPYGRREYAARDAEGHRWWFGTPLA